MTMKHIESTKILHDEIKCSEAGHQGEEHGAVESRTEDTRACETRADFLSKGESV